MPPGRNYTGVKVAWSHDEARLVSTSVSKVGAVARAELHQLSRLEPKLAHPSLPVHSRPCRRVVRWQRKGDRGPCRHG